MAGGPATSAARSPAPRLPATLARRTVRPPSSTYSRWVGLLKFVLPLVAASLLLLVGAWPELKASFDRLHIAMPRIDLREARDLRMVNARYSGVDNRNRPYVVTADVARQTPGKDDLVSLEGPKADITMQNGAWIATTSQTGIYQNQAQQLELYGDVNIYHDRGMTFATDSAHVDLAQGTADGHEHVTGHGPSGQIAADGFRILDKGDVIIFTGNARMVVNSARSEPAP
jgi:lipopolysaccharide export system protein LptC